MNQTFVVDASPVCVIDSVPAIDNVLSIGEIESTPIPNGGPGPPEQTSAETYDITMTVDPLAECDDNYDIGDLSSEDSTDDEEHPKKVR